MRFVPILFLFAVVASFNASAQSLLLPRSDSLRSDSLEQVPFSYLPIESCGYFLVPIDQEFILFQDSATFADLIASKDFIGQCKDLTIPQIDFSRHAVVGFNLFVDCNAKIWIGLVRDTASRAYRVLVDTYDGMCRGMTSHSYWLLIPALAEGESVVMKSTGHEYRWERDE